MNYPILFLPYPISTNIYYRTYRNITSLSQEGAMFKEWVKFENLKIKPTSELIGLKIIIHPKKTKAGKADNRLLDLDNCLKCILDSLIGIIYHDDKQVKALDICYGEPKIGGGTTVSIIQMENSK